MKDKFKKIGEDWKVIVMVGIGLCVVLGWLLIPALISHNKEEDTPMESTSDKSIRAASFDYKGHQYILFMGNSRLGPSGFLHNPDCRKCKLTQ